MERVLIMCYNNVMKDFVKTKMDFETLLDYNDQECHILGDAGAFLTYYRQSPKVIWVNFLWAKNPKKMLKVCKELWAISKESDSIILFDCSEFETMFKNHAEKLYIWTKEI